MVEFMLNLQERLPICLRSGKTCCLAGADSVSD
jgi:hypothetical protein